MPQPHAQFQTATAADSLRHAIDHRVATARAVHVLGILGGVTCATAGVWAGLLLLAWVVAAAGGPVIDGRLTVVGAATAASVSAWFLARAAFSCWPTRLRIAIAVERAQPKLGEQISRAIGFLTERSTGGATPADGDRGGSPALKELALTQAAAAVDHITRTPIAGAARQLLLAAAGSAALVSLAVITASSGVGRADAERSATVPDTARTPDAGHRPPRSVAAATLALWRQIETARAALAVEKTPTPQKPLLQTVAALADSSRQARAAFPGSAGSGLLALFANEFTRLEERLASDADPVTASESAAVEATTLTAVRHSLDTLSAAAHAAAGIAEAAAFERRLAALLTGWFIAAPGIPPVDLPPRRRGLLMQAALVQEDCLARIAADRATLLALHVPPAATAEGIAEAADMLAAIDEVPQKDSSAAIRDHRLAAAVQASASRAVMFERAAGLLGMAATITASESPSSQLSQFTGDAAAETLQRVGETVLERLDLLGQLERIAATVEVDAAAASEIGPIDQAATADTAGTGPADGTASSATTTSPRFGTSSAPAPGSAPAFREASADRPWAFLPAQALPLRPQAADAAAFPSHRQAIDAYYRLLFEHEPSGQRIPGSSQP